MTRSRSWLILSALLFLAPPVRAQDDDPVRFNRKLSEWRAILGSGKTLQAFAKVAESIVGPVSEPTLEKRFVKLRVAAIYVMDLEGISRSKGVDALVVALREDPDEQVRMAAVSLLGQWGGRIRPEKVTVRFTEAREAMFLALKDPVGTVREAAASAVGQLPQDEGKGAVTTLAEMLTKDSYAPARLAAADTLRGLDKEAASAVDELLAVCKDKKSAPLLRMQTALALGRIGTPESLKALPVFKELIVDTKEPIEVRKAVAESLGRIGKDASDAAAQLGKALASAEPLELRRAAMSALDKMGADSKGAIKDIKKALKDDDRFVRCQAMHTLGQYGKALDEDTKDVVTELIQALGDGSLEVRVASIETLGTLGRDAVGADADVIEKKLKDLSKDVREAVRNAATTALKNYVKE